jgi:Ca2+-dependent lipid-binding protein
MLAAMRWSAWLGILGFAVGCAYPRYTTPLNTASEAKLSSKELPQQMYSFKLVSADVPQRKISGLTWDDDGSGPDTFARLYIDGRLVWESEVIEDQVHPAWNAVLPRNVLIPSSSKFRLELWDYDTPVSADPIGSIERVGLPTQVVPESQVRIELDRAMAVVMAGAPHPHRGVGLSVEAHSDALKVYGVEPYSPASRAGIRVGQRIVGIGGQRVSAMESNDALGRLALAAERDQKLAVTDSDGHNEREVALDKGFIWLVL